VGWGAWCRREVGWIGQWVTTGTIAELEVALIVGTPQMVGLGSLRQRCSGGALASPAHPLDQAVAIEHGMDGAFGGNPDIAG